MGRFMTVTAGLLVLLMAGTFTAEARRGSRLAAARASSQARQEKVKKQAEELTEKLTLTQEQKTSLADVIEERQEKRKEILGDGPQGEKDRRGRRQLSDDQKAELEEMHKRSVVKAKDILTNEQRTICVNMAKDYKKEYEEKVDKGNAPEKHPERDITTGDGVIGFLLLHPHQLEVWGIE